ncbi:hypothetical protein AKJ16_DCAP08682 [Drosera capensis]
MFRGGSIGRDWRWWIGVGILENEEEVVVTSPFWPKLFWASILKLDSISGKVWLDIPITKLFEKLPREHLLKDPVEACLVNSTKHDFDSLEMHPSFQRSCEPKFETVENEDLLRRKMEHCKRFHSITGARVCLTP